MNVLSIDIGGTGVKILATGETERRRFESGPTMTPELMVAGVKQLAADWRYDGVSIGHPGPVRHDRPIAEPHNLAPGWVGFDFEAAFGCPVKLNQRRGDASVRKLPRGQHALPRPRNRAW